MEKLKKMDKRIIVGVISILFAFVLVLVVLPFFIKTQEQKTTVVCLTKDVAVRDMITEDCIEVREVNAINLPENIIRAKEEVLNKYATQDMYKGMLILPEQLSSLPTNINSYLWDSEYYFASIDIDSFAGGLSGKLEAGDIVSIVIEGETGAVVPEELTYMELIALTNSSGKDVNVQAEVEGEDIACTMTFKGTESQIFRLIECSRNDEIHIVLVYRGDDIRRQELLNIQTEILNGKNKAEMPEEKLPIENTLKENVLQQSDREDVNESE